MKIRATALMLALLPLACSSENLDESPSVAHPSRQPPCDPLSNEILLPEGFCAIVFAEDLGRARHIAVTTDGIVYIALRQGQEGGVVALRDQDGDGRADDKVQFGDHYGTGMEIHDGYLYFGTKSSVLRYELTPGQLEPNKPYETWIDGFPMQRQHSAKPIAFDDKQNLFVNVGGPSNACQQDMRTPGSPGMNPCPQREWQASIWKFKKNEGNQKQQVDGYRYSSGIRNSVAIAWDPRSKNMFVLQHGRDSLDTLWPKYFNSEASRDNPAEEFLKLSDGADFMWPFCYWDTQLGKKILAPEYGGDGKKVSNCNMAPEPIIAFPGHWGPNDLIFYQGEQFPQQYQGGAFIAFHGSWNREPFPQEGYNVVFVPMKNGVVDGDWKIFADGFKGADPLMSPRDARFRPTGLAEGPDGSLYITDSVTGRVWRVIYSA